MINLPSNIIGLIVTASVLFILFEQGVAANTVVSSDCHECCEYYCFDLDRKKYQSRHFSVKTAYPRLKDSELIKPFAGSRCKPIKIWSIFRHGTRYPTDEEINKLKVLTELRDQILHNYRRNNDQSTKKCRLCNVDRGLLKNWNSTAIRDDKKLLSPQGWEDLGELAHQYQIMFPELFDKKYSKEAYHFQHTRETKTISSYKAFVNSLFGETVVERDIKLQPLVEPDNLLLPFEYCKTSLEVARNITQNGTEVSKFLQTPVFKQMLRDVSLRLGFDEKILDFDTIMAIWHRCQYEQSWKSNMPDVWCSAFTQSTLKVLDYYEDLLYYQTKSYGSKINTNLACSTVTDMFQKLNAKNSTKVVAYFVHSTLLYLMLTTLEAMRPYDVELRADNYEQMQQRRKFKSSELVPFSANFAAVKYQCRATKKIMFLLNQRPLELSWCSRGLCSWSETKRKFKSTIKNCKENFCQFSSGKKVNYSIGWTVFVILIHFLLVMII